MVLSGEVLGYRAGTYYTTNTSRLPERSVGATLFNIFLKTLYKRCVIQRAANVIVNDVG